MADNPIFSYTHRDYEGSRQEGLSKIPRLSSGNWTDLNATDPGIVILDYVHALADMLSYYQDHQALESFIVTAKERANIFRLAKQLSYPIQSARCASCYVTFNSVSKYDYPILIPKYTAVISNNGIKYLTAEDAYLNAGENLVDILCIQGEVHKMTYEGTGVSRWDNSENAGDQQVLLEGTNIDVSTILVTDNLGRIWSPVEYIVFSTPTDRVYQIDLNPDNSVTLLFGDGERGALLSNTDILTIEYVTTSAEEGRVGADTLISLESSIYDNNGYYIEFLLHNKKASVGGSSAQSSISIRESAPGIIKSQNRAITLSDFENLAKLVDGVAEAKAYDINTNPDLCLHHEVKVLITPEELTSDEEILKKRVYDYLYQRMIPPTHLQILSPSRVPIDIKVTVKKLDNAVASRVSYQIYEDVDKYFKNRSGMIGEDFYPADLSNTISKVEGVRYVISITPNSPVSISDLSLASLGSLDVVVQ